MPEIKPKGGRSRLETAPIEQRTYGVEIRSDTPDDASGMHFTGHAAVFNTRTEIGDVTRWGFIEQVATGAFTKTLQEADVIFNQDHDPGRVLARTSNNTLRLSTDNIGLLADAEMAPVSYAKDISILVARGDIKGMSFAFQVVDDTWTTEQRRDEQGTAWEVDVRTINEVRLFDVCATAAPAYETTDASVRTVMTARKRAAALTEDRIGATLSAASVAELKNIHDHLTKAAQALEALTGASFDGADGDESESGDTETDPALTGPGTSQTEGPVIEPGDRSRQPEETTAKNTTDAPARTTRLSKLEMRERELAVLHGLSGPAPKEGATA
jgi:hypothetical protein